MILRSPYPDVETPRTSLPDLLFGGLTAVDNAKTALIDAGNNRRRTYGELVSAVDSIAWDDADAKSAVTELAACVTGRPGIDAGALRLARQLEPLTAVLISINKRYKIRSGISVVGVDHAATVPAAPSARPAVPAAT